MAFHTRSAHSAAPTEAYIAGILGTDGAEPVSVVSADGLASASRADLYYVADALKSLIAQNSHDMDVAWLVLCGTFVVPRWPVL
jgi:hypothetical protein